MVKGAIMPELNSFYIPLEDFGAKQEKRVMFFRNVLKLAVVIFWMIAVYFIYQWI